MRGDGKTKAMVLGLPDTGATVIVPSAPLRTYVRHMIRDLRGDRVHSASRVCVVRDTINAAIAMASRGGTFHVDHAFWDHADQSTRAAVHEFLVRQEARAA